MVAPPCRLCGAGLAHVFADLGSSPLANSYPRDLGKPEVFWPLRAYVCGDCFLVQLPEAVPPEKIFREYAYFSSTSDSWLEHARQYAEDAVERLGLGADNLVVEAASNDGYLLRYFAERGIQVLGIEPARNVAAAAVERGVPTVTEFLDVALARRLVAEGKVADLLVGNNVLAHVPDVHGFVDALAELLAVDGTLTMEFPHLLRLIEGREFDTIYHEHFSYFSLLAARRLYAEHELEVVDVEELPTHGGSLRVHARHAGAAEPAARVADLERRERNAGLEQLETYGEFEESVRAAKRDLLEFLIGVRRERKTVVGYGAAAKATTLLNYCGIRSDLLDYVVDRSAAKQGRFLPGTGLAIHPPDRVRETKPDYLLILPWNLRDEIVAQMADVRALGCRFVVPLPRVEVFD